MNRQQKGAVSRNAQIEKRNSLGNPDSCHAYFGMIRFFPMALSGGRGVGSGSGADGSGADRLGITDDPADEFFIPDDLLGAREP